MAHIRILPDDKRVEVAVGESILDAALRAGIPHAHACGGTARCSTCRVRVENGLRRCVPRDAKEDALAAQLQFDPGIRLACQTWVTGDVTLSRLVLDDEDVAVIRDLKSGEMHGSVGVEKKIAILFADIRGFTSFAESLPAYDVVHALNRYFHGMSEAVRRHGGHVDNYMGDGLMALFGTSDPRNAALHAVKAGLEMLDEVGCLKPYFLASYGRDFDIRIGIHYGTAVVGTVGSAHFNKLTAIGDAVNLASRIETANKRAGTRLLISRETFLRVRSRVQAEKKCVRITLPGKSGEHTLYEVKGLKPSSGSR